MTGRKAWVDAAVSIGILGAALALGGCGGEGDGTAGLGIDQTGRTYVAYAGGKSDIFYVPKDYGIGDGENGAVLITVDKKPKASGKTGAIYLNLDAAAEAVFRGKEIFVRVYAKPYNQKSAEKFTVDYSTNAVGNSNWKWFPIQDFEEMIYEFRYPYPADVQEADNDYIGIWPDVTGSELGIVVSRVEAGLDAVCPWPGLINDTRSFCEPN